MVKSTGIPTEHLLSLDANTMFFLGKLNLGRNIGAFERKSPQGFSNDFPVLPYCILGLARLGLVRQG